ncbi:hypothetical protein G7046_g8607 [Stylonectria norvegica]|nr:hypothetical protein G7046_g8607 [Stylonectria norvegica]
MLRRLHLHLSADAVPPWCFQIACRGLGLPSAREELETWESPTSCPTWHPVPESDVSVHRMRCHSGLTLKQHVRPCGLARRLLCAPREPVDSMTIRLFCWKSSKPGRPGETATNVMGHPRCRRRTGPFLFQIASLRAVASSPEWENGRLWADDRNVAPLAGESRQGRTRLARRVARQSRTVRSAPVNLVAVAAALIREGHWRLGSRPFHSFQRRTNSPAAPPRASSHAEVLRVVGVSERGTAGQRLQQLVERVWRSPFTAREQWFRAWLLLLLPTASHRRMFIVQRQPSTRERGLLLVAHCVGRWPAAPTTSQTRVVEGAGSGEDWDAGHDFVETGQDWPARKRTVRK